MASVNNAVTHGIEHDESDGNTSFLRAARNGQLEKVLEYLKTNIDINTSNANGLNALHLASKDGHVEIVEELLKRGAIVDAATKKGNTALHIASLAGQEEVVKLLVQHGASVNVQSQNGFTPLYMAAQENHDNVVKYLLANGANQSLSTEDGFTPLAVAMQQGHDKVVTVLLENDTRGKVRLPALHIAAKKDDVRAAKLLLENDHNPDVTSKSGFTPLHIASHYGNQPIANLLIQKGADVNYSAKHNITPLHVAAKWGKSNMVSLLLEQGAHIEAKTRDGLTPLHCAARSGHEQVVDMLLEKSAPISSKTKNGLAPLHMAAQGDHVDAARILLYHRAPVDEVTVDYLTALHVAAHCGHVRVAKLLLDRQADANARALNGFTPLHIACKKNRIKVVELLLNHGACIGATTESGLTPLHVASFMGCMNIVIYLLQHDASPDIPTVRGETPLHLAARANQTDIIRILLRNGAQVDARAREQQTPLHVASRLGNVDIVMLLLQHGAKIDNTTKDMYTALHIAAKEGQDEVAAVLIENGASLNSTTKKGFTPLHLAAKYGHLKVAKLLVQKEAPVDAQGKNGVTPLHVASHYDHQNVALLLLDKGASPHAEAKNGHTPLHIAARKNQMDIAHTLLEYGAKPDVESKAGFTPLHLSSQEGHAEISSLLLEHKATPDYQSKNGLTPMHLCAQENKVSVAELLYKNGAEIDKQTKAGYTPLHIASHYGQADMVKFLLSKGADVKATTSLGYTPLHQAAQQGHTNIVNLLLENSAQPNAITNNGQTPLHIAQKLGYITVIDTLKEPTEKEENPVQSEEKYRVVAPELMHETFLSDSEEEGEDTLLGDQTYRYLTADEMKSLGDDSLPIDVTRDERVDSNRMVGSDDPNAYPPRHIEDSISPEHIHPNYVEYIKKATDNVDISRHPVNIGFLVSFLVDARGGAMRGCRHSGVRVIVPPRCAPSPTRITCRYVRPQRTPHPPPLMEGEALASRVLELGPVGAKFLGPVIIEVPHFAALRGKEREIVILRSDNGESWKEHTVEATEDVLNEVLRDSFETEDLNQLEDTSSGRTTRIITQDFPQYFAVISRIRQEVHAIGPEGGMVSSTVVPQVQAVFPQGALTKKIKVGLQAQPIDPELTAKLLGHGVAVSPVVTVEPRRRKFHKAITLSMPAPRAHSQGMINQYSGSAPTLRLLCSITGGTSRAQWEDVTGSTPLTFVNDCVSFTTTVSARFWLMDCRNIGDATKMATELYREAIHVPFIAKFVVFAKRIDPLEARLRVFCMTDDKEDKTLEYQEQFTEIAKSRDVEVLEGKSQYIEFAGNLVPITKSGEQLQFSFRAFKENRLPFSVRVKDQHAEAVSRCLFMREPKVQKGEPPQQPICILNIVLPDDIVSETISLTDSESLRKKYYANENFDYYRQDPRLADMSNLLGQDWVELANQLGLTSSEINVIKSEYPDSVAKQAQSMLRMWLSQSGNRVQTNSLENALRRIGREDIADQCLNVDNRNQEILRIRSEEKDKHRLIGDNRIEERASQERFTKEERVTRSFSKDVDKYSAEEKTFEPSDEEEDFNKSVPERREQIVKRLSTERTIPSSQRVEIVQEITSIKRQSLVEDKIAEVQQKANIEPMRMNTIKPVSKIIQEKKEQEVKTEVEVKLEKTQIDAQNTEKSKEPNVNNLDTQEKPDRRDSVLLEEVTQLLETRKPASKVSEQDDPNSPKFSKTPPPSPADFIKEKQATTIQEWNANAAEDHQKFNKSQPETVREEIAGKTTSTEYLIKLDDKLLDTTTRPDVGPFPNAELENFGTVEDKTNAFPKAQLDESSEHHETQEKVKKIISHSTDAEPKTQDVSSLNRDGEVGVTSEYIKSMTAALIENEKNSGISPPDRKKTKVESNFITNEVITIVEKQDKETSKEFVRNSIKYDQNGVSHLSKDKSVHEFLQTAEKDEKIKQNGSILRAAQPEVKRETENFLLTEIKNYNDGIYYLPRSTVAVGNQIEQVEEQGAFPSIGNDSNGKLPTESTEMKERKKIGKNLEEPNSEQQKKKKKSKIFSFFKGKSEKIEKSESVKNGDVKRTEESSAVQEEIAKQSSNEEKKVSDKSILGAGLKVNEKEIRDCVEVVSDNRSIIEEKTIEPTETIQQINEENKELIEKDMESLEKSKKCENHEQRTWNDRVDEEKKKEFEKDSGIQFKNVQWQPPEIRNMTDTFLDNEKIHFHDVKYLQSDTGVDEYKKDSADMKSEFIDDENVLKQITEQETTKKNEGKLESSQTPSSQDQTKPSKKQEKTGFLSFFTKTKNDKFVSGEEIYDDKKDSDSEKIKQFSPKALVEKESESTQPVKEFLKMSPKSKKSQDDFDKIVNKDETVKLWSPAEVQNMTEIFLTTEQKNYHDKKSEKDHFSHQEYDENRKTHSDLVNETITEGNKGENEYSQKKTGKHEICRLFEKNTKSESRIEIVEHKETPEEKETRNFVTKDETAAFLNEEREKYEDHVKQNGEENQKLSTPFKLEESTSKQIQKSTSKGDEATCQKKEKSVILTSSSNKNDVIETEHIEKSPQLLREIDYISKEENLMSGQTVTRDDKETNNKMLTESTNIKITEMIPKEQEKNKKDETELLETSAARNQAGNTHEKEDSHKKKDKSGIFSFFGSKSKKEKKVSTEGKEDSTEQSQKSHIVTKDETSAFLKQEIENYQNGHVRLERTDVKNKELIDKYSLKNETLSADVNDKEHSGSVCSATEDILNQTREFLNCELGNYDDGRNIEVIMKTEEEKTKILKKIDGEESLKTDDLNSKRRIESEQKSNEAIEKNTESTKQSSGNIEIERKRKKSSLFSFFRKKSSEESQEEAEMKVDGEKELKYQKMNKQQNSNIETKHDDAVEDKNETNFDHDKLKKLTNDFLSLETQFYHDVKSNERNIESEEKPEKMKKKGIFKLFERTSVDKQKIEQIDKKSDEKQPSEDADSGNKKTDIGSKKSEEPDESSKSTEKFTITNFLKMKSNKKSKNESENVEDKLKGDTEGNLEVCKKASSSFLLNEKEKYEDSKYVPQKPEIIPEKQNEDQEKKQNEPKKETDIIYPVKKMKEISKKFLKTEIHLYEDVKWTPSEKLDKQITIENGEHEKNSTNEKIDTKKTEEYKQVVEKHETKTITPNENKPTKKQEKTGIIGFFKDKLKIGSKTDSGNDTKEEAFYKIDPEVKSITSSFLLEEKRRYEDGQYKSKQFTAKEDEKHGGKVEIERNEEKKRSSTPAEVDIVSETILSSSIQKEVTQSSGVELKERENVNTSNGDNMEIDEKSTAMTRSSLERERIQEFNEANQNLSYTTSDENENIFEPGRGTPFIKPRDQFTAIDKDTTKNFLMLEKQFYDYTPEESKNIQEQIIVETERRKEQLQKDQPEMRLGDATTIPENGENEVSESNSGVNTKDTLTKKSKKKGILGFLKKKSEEVDEKGQSEPKLPDVQTQGETNLKDEQEKSAISEKIVKEEDKKKKKKKHSKSLDDEDATDSKKSILGFLFKKKKPKDKEESSTYHEADDFIKILEDTKTFLHRETEMYQDNERCSVRISDVEPKDPVVQQEYAISSKLTQKEVIQEKNQENHDNYTQEERITKYQDNTKQTIGDRDEDTNSEYTAFDFIKEEIETFESTRLPNTNKVDSSIRIETEVETIDGDTPKEIITKKIIISEKLVEGKDISDRKTAEEILKKLMNVNEELKAQLDLEKSTFSELEREIEEPSEGRKNELEDMELFDIPEKRTEELVTDLDELSSEDSRKNEEIIQRLRKKYPECSEYMPIIDDKIKWRNIQENQRGSESGEIKERSGGKRGTITKIQEHGHMSDVPQGTEDLVTDLKLEYSTHMGEAAEQESPKHEKVSSEKTKRKPMFRIESEEENSSSGKDKDANTELDQLLFELRKNHEDEEYKSNEEGRRREENKEQEDKEKAQTDIDVIEKKLADLGKALDTLEQLNEKEPSDKSEVRERKLRRVERKFEHMASETDQLATVDQKPIEKSKSEETEQYQHLVSQLSQDEVMTFQGEYNNLWDEYTFSKTDEWDSKTPDSQADVLDLPQGEIVYMAPVKLNINHSVNKAGVEVDVIPIMRSPHISPKLRKKKKVYRSTTNSDDFDRQSSNSSEHSTSYLQGPITERILEINPKRFLSGTAINESDSFQFEEKLLTSKSLDNISDLPRDGPIMNAVVSWLNTATEEKSDHMNDGRSPKMKTVKTARELQNQSQKTRSISHIILSLGETSQGQQQSEATTSREQQEVLYGKDDGQVRQQPKDQHQLSSEMRELLEEMERASQK